MNKYELMVVVDVQKNQDEKDSVSKQAADAVSKAGGKVVNNQVWLEKHKFPFKIKKCTEGAYYLIKFEGPGAVVKKTKQILRLNDGILRYAITKDE